MYDIIIVGAGPAGLTAAIYSLRAGKSVLILDKAGFGGQITFSPKVENYPAEQSLSGSELADKMVSQVLNLGAEVEIEEVTEILSEENKTVLTLDGNRYEAKAVIIAAGAEHRHLGLEGEEKFIGDGISFCAVCDGAFYQNKTVALIGGGNSALQEAILLSETCKKVFVVQNLPFLTGEQKLQDILRKRGNVEIITDSTVSAILGDQALNGIRIKNTSGEESELSIDGLFVAIGLAPKNECFKSVADLDEAGYIASNESCLTKTEGVFTAGDCRTKAIRQVTTATADGTVAALAACRYIDNL